MSIYSLVTGFLWYIVSWNYGLSIKMNKVLIHATTQSKLKKSLLVFHSKDLKSLSLKSISWHHQPPPPRSPPPANLLQWSSPNITYLYFNLYLVSMFPLDVKPFFIAVRCFTIICAWVGYLLEFWTAFSMRGKKKTFRWFDERLNLTLQGPLLVPLQFHFWGQSTNTWGGWREWMWRRRDGWTGSNGGCSAKSDKYGHCIVG